MTLKDRTNQILAYLNYKRTLHPSPGHFETYDDPYYIIDHLITTAEQAADEAYIALEEYENVLLKSIAYLIVLHNKNSPLFLKKALDLNIYLLNKLKEYK